MSGTAFLKLSAFESHVACGEATKAFNAFQQVIIAEIISKRLLQRFVSAGTVKPVNMVEFFGS